MGSESASASSTSGISQNGAGGIVHNPPNMLTVMIFGFALIIGALLWAHYNRK